MPRYHDDPGATLLDPSLKVGWRTRLRRRRDRITRSLPRPRLTRRQRRGLIGGLLALPVLAVAAWWIATSPTRSARSRPGEILLGRNAPLGGMRLFPDDNAWNTPIDDRPVAATSDALITWIGLGATLHPDFGSNRLGTRLYGIPYVVVDGSTTPLEEVAFDYGRESDSDPYPIPADVPIEIGGDRHAIILDRESWTLYELYKVSGSAGGWDAGSGAIFDLRSNQSRPRGWTSADAAGLAILPGLVRADEVYDLGEIRHALRFTLPRTRNAFVYPARHQASRNADPILPPMGLRLRLKADVDLQGFPRGARVIAEALKHYGMILADNGGPLYLTGTADRRWKRRDIAALKRLTASDFEVIVPPPPPATDLIARDEMRRGLPGFSGR